MHGWVALIALSLCGCPKAAPPAVAAVGDLAFAWPDGAVGERTAERYSRREVAGERRERVIVASERITVTKDASGWSLRVTDGRFESVNGSRPEPLLAALAAVPQEVRIDADGAFVGLVEPDRWASEARSELQKVVDPRDVMGQIQIDLAIQPERLDGVLAGEWRSIIGFWVGRPVAPGPLGTIDGFDARGEASPVGASLTVEGTERCGASTCARLVARSPIAPDELAGRGDSVRKAWVEAVEPPPAASSVDAVRGELVVEVVLEPGTMLPHRYEVSEVVEGVVRVDEQTMAFRDEEGKTVRWTWKLPGGAP